MAQALDQLARSGEHVCQSVAKMSRLAETLNGVVHVLMPHAAESKDPAA